MRGPNLTDYVRQLPPHQFGQRKRVSEWVRVDLLSLFLISLIATYGLIILMSAVDQNTARVEAQVIRIIVAFSVMIVMAQIPPRLFLRLAPALYLLGLLLLFLVLLAGTESKGATRWLRIGPIGFQPSELMKLALPMVLAWYFHDRRLPPRPRHVGIATLIIAVPVLMIYPQPDLGTSILVAASGLLVLFLAGISWRYIFSLMGLFLVSAPGLWFVMTDYQRGRILTLVDPERDPLGSGWNIIQSMTAIGSGGLFGKGLFNGTQSQLDFLPESRTDFIIAVLAEELGLIGVLALLSLYICLIGRGVVIAVQAQDTFGRLLAASITFTFFVYVFVNIGMVSALLPVVGVPLPLVSYGGTSMLTLCAGFGILMSVHTHRRITL